MSNIIQYKGYFASVDYSVEGKVLYGKIEGINDLINFESESADQIENEFHEAVDEYLRYCESIGKKPDKTYRGSFNVRIPSEMHKALAIRALKNGISIDQAVECAIRDYLTFV